MGLFEELKLKKVGEELKKVPFAEEVKGIGEEIKKALSNPLYIQDFMVIMNPYPESDLLIGVPFLNEKLYLQGLNKEHAWGVEPRFLLIDIDKDLASVVSRSAICIEEIQRGRKVDYQIRQINSRSNQFAEVLNMLPKHLLHQLGIRKYETITFKGLREVSLPPL